MEFTIPERVTLLGVLPAKGSFVEMAVIRELRAEAEFTDEEKEQGGVQTVGNKVMWTTNFSKEIAIGQATKAVIVKALMKADEDERITTDMVPLYERFVVGQPSDEGEPDVKE
jgi:hypothetical protein